MLTVLESKNYKKSLLLYLKRKNFSINKLETVIILLQKQIPLDVQYHDHKLKGDLDGTRECHIYPDVLLLYKVLDKELVLLLMDIGSHSNLF